MGGGIVIELLSYHLNNYSWGPTDVANPHAEPIRASSTKGTGYYGGDQ